MHNWDGNIGVKAPQGGLIATNYKSPAE